MKRVPTRRRPVATLAATTVLAVLLAGCQALTAGAWSGLSPADEAAIRATAGEQERAAASRDWQAVAATYAEDAILLPPNRPEVAGREAIAAWYGQLPPFITRMDSTVTEITGGGDVALVRGHFVMTLALPGAAAPIEERGKFLDGWRRQPDGRWLIWRSSFSANHPRPPPPR